MHYMDLTPECRAKVEEQGYLVPEKLELADVVVSNEDLIFVPDWHHVVALINKIETQDIHNTIVIYDNQRIIKARTTTCQMMKRLRETFAVDFYNDIRRTAGRALGIKKSVPFICQDFWLMPMNQRISENRSWFRWHHRRDFWYHFDNVSRVVVANQMVLEWQLSEFAIRHRQKRCKQIASYFRQKLILMCPILDDKEFRLSPADLKKAIVEEDRLKRAQVLQKVGFLEFHEQVDKELNKQQYDQIPETEF
ncbi:hypothetical protein HC026_00950 [Lactobacillus sp. LC28-10]|uniref:Uncharacterized protein n=1 Tax=Secundilactobacillus angelensis TaxID=2722706 RepID=A0ABX1KV22_9LACO|nr:competence protein ComK [Secundilactobacillus angelensis]MCH5461325.1 competence protein ComK [Secundilactobacillus angelensis]NLR17479.1 hypothetical protein [Secundilactobacillus angelensis]